MREILKRLAYKWCEEYGNEQHHKAHHDIRYYEGIYNPFCGNCNDGFSYAKEVLKAVKERLS